MKKAVYPLVAALILCLVGIGMLLSARVGDRQEINRLQSEIAALLEEQADWDAQKAQVSKSLSGVRSVLVKTLVDLEDVATSLGTAMDSIDGFPQSPGASPLPEDTKPTGSAAPTTAEVTTTPDTASPTPQPEPIQGTDAPTDKPAASTAPTQEADMGKQSSTSAPKSTVKP